MTTDVLTTLPLIAEAKRPARPSWRSDHRLIVVSNREPYRRVETEEGTAWQRTHGGLVSALDPVMRRCNGTWIAWDPCSPRSEITRSRVPGGDRSFTLLRVPLARRDVERYYHGFANRALWPLCHYFTDRCRFDPVEWREYRHVNEQFAAVVADHAGDNDLIWVHDYHFCLLPRLLRAKRSAPPIAFFLHIPFPAPEVFRIFPWREELLDGLLGADLIGFHCSSYARHFLHCCRQTLGAEVDFDEGTARWRNRTTRAVARPIGIEVEELGGLSRDPAIVERGKQIRRTLGVEKVILGIDRLDYTKGIPERLRAIDRLFADHPEHRRRVTFVQVAVPSRRQVPEYKETKRLVDELVGRINGRRGDTEWQPIRYSNLPLGRRDLVAHFLAADIGLVTPLRDGLNLVALEFCACRQDDGVLVLSELAGAAERLADSALLVNPHACHAMADALHRALVMPTAEQARRMRDARQRVIENDVHQWVDTVLDTLAYDDGPEAACRALRAVARLDPPAQKS